MACLWLLALAASGPQRVLKLEPVQTTARRLDASHSVTLHNYENLQFKVTIEIGSNKQRFEVVPDTGSSDLWVASVNCSCPTLEHKYNPWLSSSAHPINERIGFRYGDATEASGVSVIDQFRLGTVHVDEQYFIAVDDFSQHTKMHADGILGLGHYFEGFSRHAQARTFIGTLFEENPELDPQFAFFLGPDESDSSKLIFGDVDIDAYAQEKRFRYGKSFYMGETHLWLTSLWSLGLQGSGYELTWPERGAEGEPAMIDSGTSLIVLSPSLHEIVVASLEAALGSRCSPFPLKPGLIACPCPEGNQEHWKLPPLEVGILTEDGDPTPLCMAPSEYLLRYTDEITNMPICVPAFERGGPEQPVAVILGMAFLRAYYTVFDVEEKRIGFARSRLAPGGVQCRAAPYPVLESALRVVGLGFAAAALAWTYLVCRDTRTEVALLSAAEG